MLANVVHLHRGPRGERDGGACIRKRSRREGERAHRAQVGRGESWLASAHPRRETHELPLEVLVWPDTWRDADAALGDRAAAEEEVACVERDRRPYLVLARSDEIDELPPAPVPLAIRAGPPPGLLAARALGREVVTPWHNDALARKRLAHACTVRAAELGAAAAKVAARLAAKVRAACPGVARRLVVGARHVGRSAKRAPAVKADEVARAATARRQAKVRLETAFCLHAIDLHRRKAALPVGADRPNGPRRGVREEHEQLIRAVRAVIEKARDERIVARRQRAVDAAARPTRQRSVVRAQHVHGGLHAPRAARHRPAAVDGEQRVAHLGREALRRALVVAEHHYLEALAKRRGHLKRVQNIPRTVPACAGARCAHASSGK